MRPSRPPRRPLLPAATAALLLAGCGGSNEVQIPEPRPIVVYSGERLRADPEEMQEVHGWLTEALETIEMDPAFLIVSEPVVREAYPWESVRLDADTAWVDFDRTHPDALTSYQIYAFLRLMERQDRLEEWAPEAAAAERGWEREKLFVDRVADTWLLGRTVFDTAPFVPLDALIYARAAGYLDALLVTARGAEFPDAREEWMENNPGELEEYRNWFMETFNQEPPGWEGGG